MGKKILTWSIFIFTLNLLIGQNPIVSYAENNEYNSFSFSVHLKTSLSTKGIISEVDKDSFERFLKYSMYVTDKDALTIEQIDLCKTVFATERSSSPNLRCIYARETIKSGEKPKRGSIDDKQFLADMSGYNTIDIFPDIVYYDIYDAYNMGQTSEVVEYWLDDNGNERVIAQAGMEGPYYQIYYDKAPDYAELDKVIEFCDKGGTLIDNDDGSFIYAGMINGRKYKENKTFEIYTADIWKYIIKDDGTAVITDCKLPKGIDVEPINEPIVLPNELDGHKVTGITCSFSDSCITKLVIPENYRHIERFVNMKYLKEVEINSPELNLVSPCFLSCPDLECVKLNVKSVGTGTFVECPQLHKVEINGAEEIACCAFSDLPALNEVTLPDNLKYIGQDAFTNTNVTELVIPKNVEIIGILRPCYIKNGELVDPLTLDCIKIANDECIIKGYSNTEAQIYADTNGYNFVSFDANYGDANCDGSVDMADVVLIMQALANPNKYGIDGSAEHHLTEQGRNNGDMDGNGLTVGDAQAIQRKLLGLDSESSEIEPELGDIVSIKTPYRPAMSDWSGIGILLEFDSKDYSITLSTNEGHFTTWDIETGDGVVTNVGKTYDVGNKGYIFWTPDNLHYDEKFESEILVIGEKNGKSIEVGKIVINMNDKNTLSAVIK